MSDETSGLDVGGLDESGIIMSCSTKVEQFTPTFDNVLVKVLDDGETRGGIRLPEGVYALGMPRGVVVATGPGRTELGTFVATKVKRGQTVAFSINQMYPPAYLNFSGKLYALVRERDIAGTISEEVPGSVVKVDKVEGAGLDGVS